MKKLMKILSVGALLVLLLSITAMATDTVVDSGNCGEEALWTLSSSGELRIFGAGSIANYATEANVPWSEYKTTITSLTIDSGITELEGYAFKNCSSLTSVSIASSVSLIGEGTFSGCSRLEEITLPFIGNKAILTASDTIYPFGYIFGRSNYDGAVATSQKYYTPDASSIFTSYYIPENLTTVTVTTADLPRGAFYSCENLITVVVSEGIASVDRSAFFNCTNLVSVSLPQTITDLGSGAFENCSSLTEIVLPNKITVLDKYTFDECSALENVTLPAQLETINSYVFQNCTSLQSVTFPDSLRLIDSYAFLGSGLTELILPEGLTTVNSQAFISCHSLSSVYFPSTLTHLGGNLFNDCPELTTAGPSSGNYNIRYAWTDELPSSVFSGCEYLTIAVLPSNLKAIPSSTFSGCSVLSTINIPVGITSIGSGAFQNCAALENFIVPSNVTTIEYNAFSGCRSLNFIVFPKSVTSMGWGLLQNCTALKSVFYFGTEADWNNISIKSNSNAVLTDTPRYYVTAYSEICEVVGHTDNDGNNSCDLCNEAFETIEVVTLPKKLNYKIGSTFDATGMVVAIRYNSSTSEEILNYNVSYDFSKVGNTYVSITYNGMETGFEVNVSPFDGAGTLDNPYLIETKTQLNAVRDYIHSNFKLANDIIFTSSDFSYGGEFYNSGAGWESIGLVAFYGTFDGNNHAIYNLKSNVKDNETTGVGLFSTNRGTITNLHLLNCNLTATTTDSGYVQAGCIAQINRGTISNCVATGSITSDSKAYVYAGGIVGTNSGAIHCCYSNVDISVTYEFYSSNSYYYPYAGGIVGCNDSNVTYGEINNCYSMGDIKVTSTGYHAYAYAGGIAAENRGYIRMCYSLSALQATANGSKTSISYIGGIVGQNYGQSVEHCYYLDTIEQGIGHGTASGTVIKCNDSQMKSQDTYTDFDFDSIWTIDDAGDYLYPQLIPCGACKHSYTTQPSDMIASEANCFEAAVYYVECDYCSKVSKTVTVSVGAPRGHLWSPWEADNSSSHTRVCTGGCETHQTEAHCWEDLSENGEYFAQCSDCGTETPRASLSADGKIIAMILSDPAVVFGAAYDSTGKMIAVQQGIATGNIVVINFTENMSPFTIKVFLLDSNFAPVSHRIVIDAY